MKTRTLVISRIAVPIGLALWGLGCRVVFAASGPPVEWPRVFVREGVTNTIYQPQLETWDYLTLTARSAVAIQPRGSAQAEFGLIEFQAKTRVDRAQREVFFDEIQIASGDFPSAGEKAAGYLATLRSLLPKEVKSLSLDSLEASMGILEATRQSQSQPLKNDPPAILFANQPSLLIPVDGTPVYRPVEGTTLERVINTRALILRDQSGRHYLHLFNGYVEAPGFDGPWTVAKSPPGDVAVAEKQAIAAKQVDLLTGQENPQTRLKPSLKTTPVPALHVATVPTELIVITGEPQWAPLPPTQLLYVTNTTSPVIKDLRDQKTYVLISGRWFRGPGFGGPWEFVLGANLPQDFANIPDSSPLENAKASVPGTTQARESVIANDIPQTVKVDRQKAKMDPSPQYDGSPRLEPIDGTSLQYAANTATPVIRVDEKTWYACQNGVWFVAGAAAGPWVVATLVPAVIYSIPPSAPIYYVTYSRIYRYDGNFVWVGTTPGYYGTVITSDGTVVYGTGYYYPPYIGTTTYVSYSITYGYGCTPCWTPWAGWAFGFAVGWAMSDDWYWWCGCPPMPYWGPYYYPCYRAYYNPYGGITAWGPYGWAGTSGYIYHQNGPWTGVTRGAAGYNAWTGNQWATKYGRAYNSTTGTRVAGQRGAVENVYTGNYAYGGRGVAYNDRTGAAAAGGKVTWGNQNTGNQGTAGRGTIYNPNTGNTTHISGIKGDNGGAINVNGNVVVGKDGNYYRPDGSGGWEQVSKPTPGATPFGASGGGTRQPTATPQNPGARVGGQQPTPGAQNQWNKVQPTPANQQQFQSLNNEYRSRQQGAQRQQSFQRNQPAFRGGGGGGRRR